MAVCWSFAMVLLIALASLHVSSRSLPEPPAGFYINNSRHLEASEASIKNLNPRNALVGRSDVEQSWNVLVGRRGRFRRLVQQDDDLVCDAQLTCMKKEVAKSTSSMLDVVEGLRTREILVNYRLPQRKPTPFQSERMVPSGPNPLHNSNRSQVIFP
ncbi:uncharacterized protein [Physcomitrium patens]|uniref:Uncharacterized protein n=2 Tax=Physcomitrium patens TaxID=3218 RepID=A0A2K1ICN6_PHYPA|nr:uncharacterized protein LOC112277826 [Physcomitrium patens]PNR27039.1 hypothetical protein PHYPA_030520 [Physcomitrium patens]|eukprot:XP_024366357.1 uncharacterized protein LOC112277826 [Physcomitrella patens]